MIAAPSAPARRLAGVEGADLWCASLDQSLDDIGRMTAILAPAERERADAMSAEPRRRFVVGRATLRTILGAECGTAPAQLSFAYGHDGKPSLVLPGAADAPQFNVSHARDVVLIAVAGRRPVGVDVEWIEGSTQIDRVAQRFFSEAERAFLDGTPSEARRRIFYQIWVRKEAYLKGRGEGISAWIYQTDFSSLDAPRAGAPARDQDQWLVRDIAGLPAGYVASIALARATS